MHTIVFRTVLIALLVGSMQAIAGCNDRTAPAPGSAPAAGNQSREAPPSASAPASEPRSGEGVDAAGDDRVSTTFLGLRASRPASWREETPQSSMHHATFRVPGAGGGQDAQVVVFGNIGGSAHANIQRWEDQFRTAEGGDARAQVRAFEAGALGVTLAELEGDYRGMTPTYTPNQRFLAAIINTPRNEQFFIRLVGDHATVTAHREAFMAMIEGLEWVGE